MEIKSLKQTIKHDPENGKWGNCHQICYAMILNRPIEKIPHFYDNGRTDKEILHEFLDKNNLREVDVLFPGSIQLEEVIQHNKIINDDVPYILGCKSRNGYNHSVVVDGFGEIHDPGDSGIAGPFEWSVLEGHDTVWVCTFLTFKDPSKGV